MLIVAHKMRRVRPQTGNKMLDIITRIAHNMRMKRCSLNKVVLAQWVDKVGGLKSATLLVEDKLKCSYSKAEKIAGGRYPSKLTFAEQKELASLLKCKVADLVDVSASDKQAS